jgi:hypothetical protein
MSGIEQASALDRENRLSGLKILPTRVPQPTMRSRRSARPAAEQTPDENRVPAIAGQVAHTRDENTSAVSGCGMEQMPRAGANTKERPGAITTSLFRVLKI